MGNHEFRYNERLGIKLPELYKPYESFSLEERTEIVTVWEEIRGRIPSRVIELERVIEDKLHRLADEEDFGVSCLLNGEIADLASVINDLHIWYRMQADVNSNKVQL
ncbi:hypothetical protein [Paenibacillus pinistramenti]|uniref:hypothetical protein n=1 Tax=Paenibacillus pinistramenti TaxID=1768003 RepID=UPI001107FF5B|nr:hypothetical protein [Paenibacillus pinistramenti]